MRIRNFPREVWRDSVSSGNLAKTISFSHPVIVWEIRVHLSAAPAALETFTATMDAAAGAAYDAVVASQDMSGLTNKRFEGPIHLDEDDDLDLAMVNSLNRTIGVEVWYEELR